MYLVIKSKLPCVRNLHMLASQDWCVAMETLFIVDVAMLTWCIEGVAKVTW